MNDDDIWFEDVLVPTEEGLEEAVRTLMLTDPEVLAEEEGLESAIGYAKGDPEALAEYAGQVQGVIRVHYPRARPVESGASPAPEQLAGSAPLATGKAYLVRLGIELALPEEAIAAKWRYKAAWCRTRLYAQYDRCRPRVVDLYPLRHQEGEPATVHINLSPSIKAGPIEGGIGSISTDLRVGHVAPSTLGYFGQDDREPYWEMREKEKEVRGLYHFWLLIDVPTGCDPRAVFLQLMAEADVQTHLFGMPVGPKRRAWAEQRTISLHEIIARQA